MNKLLLLNPLLLPTLLLLLLQLRRLQMEEFASTIAHPDSLGNHAPYRTATHKKNSVIRINQ